MKPMALVAGKRTGSPVTRSPSVLRVFGLLARQDATKASAVNAHHYLADALLGAYGEQAGAQGAVPYTQVCCQNLL